MQEAATGKFQLVPFDAGSDRRDSGLASWTIWLSDSIHYCHVLLSPRWLLAARRQRLNFSGAVRALSWLRGSQLPKWLRRPLTRWGIGLIEACDFKRSVQTRLKVDHRASFSVAVGLLGPSPINVFVVVAIYRTLRTGVGVIPGDWDSAFWPWDYVALTFQWVFANAFVAPILDVLTRIITIVLSMVLLVLVTLVILLGLRLPGVYARLDERLGGPQRDAGRRVQDYLFFVASLPFLGILLLGEIDGNKHPELLFVLAGCLALASGIIGIRAQLRYRRIAGFGLDLASRRASAVPLVLGFGSMVACALLVMLIQGVLGSPSWNEP
jgi:hypothetical protein